MSVVSRSSVGGKVGEWGRGTNELTNERIKGHKKDEPEPSDWNLSMPYRKNATILIAAR